MEDLYKYISTLNNYFEAFEFDIKHLDYLHRLSVLFRQLDDTISLKINLLYQNLYENNNLKYKLNLDSII